MKYLFFLPNNKKGVICCPTAHRFIYLCTGRIIDWNR